MNFRKMFQKTWRVEDWASLIRPRVSKISVQRLCMLLSAKRSKVCYTPVPEKPGNIKMMEIMDKHFTDHPPEGVTSIVVVFIAQHYPWDPRKSGVC
jgi:hypothetical protein